MIKNFLRDDAGAVTIDWVALTAGVLLLGLGVVTFIFSNGVETLLGNINTELEAADPAALTFDGVPTPAPAP